MKIIYSLLAVLLGLTACQQEQKELAVVSELLCEYSERESNPHGHYWPQDFKSGVSTYSTIRATAYFVVRRGKSSKIISMCKSLSQDIR